MVCNSQHGPQNPVTLVTFDTLLTPPRMHSVPVRLSSAPPEDQAWCGRKSELSRHKTLEPKSSASTNSATSRKLSWDDRQGYQRGAGCCHKWFGVSTAQSLWLAWVYPSERSRDYPNTWHATLSKKDYILIKTEFIYYIMFFIRGRHTV